MVEKTKEMIGSLEHFRALGENLEVGILVYYDKGIIYKNKALSRITGYANEDVQNWSLQDYTRVVHPEDQEKIISQAQKWLSKDEDALVRYECQLITKTGELKYVNIYPTRATYNNQPATVAVIIDSTKEKEQEEALKFRLEYEQILSQTLNDLVTQPIEGLWKIITTALKRITPFIGATCGFIIQISRNKNIITKTHQWCDEPVATPIDLFESIPASYFEHYFDRLTKNETIIIREPEDIPPKAHAVAEWMQKQGFRSQLLIPMISNREVIGILGFISQIEKPVHWKTKKILLMKFLANVFVTAFERKQTMDTLRIHRELTMAVKSTYSITETIEQFLESASHLESIDFAVAYLYDPNKKTYHLTGQKGFSEEFIATMQNLKKSSFLGRLITAGKPVYSLFSALVPEDIQKIYTTIPQALAILPISYEKQVLGSLFFASKSLSDFPDVERTILETAAFQLGNVITRIQTISALKQREKSSRIKSEKKI